MKKPTPSGTPFQRGWICGRQDARTGAEPTRTDKTSAARAHNGPAWCDGYKHGYTSERVKLQAPLAKD